MAKEHRFIPCLLERFFIKAGYVLVHDGQRLSGKESEKVQFILPPEEVRYFIHRLEKTEDGRVVGKAYFEYNLRNWLVVDFDFVEIGQDGTRERQRMMLFEERLAQTEERARRESSHGKVPEVAKES